MSFSNHKPPKWILNFFRWYCHPEYQEDLEGDLRELYDRKLQLKGKRRANMYFLVLVLSLFRPGIIRSPQFSQPLIYHSMLRHHLLISWRQLTKQKGYAFLNIGGLALGMGVAMLIGLWVWDELSFNTYHENYDRISQILRQQNSQNERFTSPFLPSAVGGALETAYGEYFERVVMVRQLEEHMISREENSFVQAGYFMQSEGPDMFSLRWVRGNAEGFADPNTILLSESLADKLFGSLDPVNQLLSMDGDAEVKVIGVYEDLPLNSTFKDASFIAPLSLFYTLTGLEFDVWTNYNLRTYVQLSPQADLSTVNLAIKDELARNVGERARKSQATLLAHPMRKWHLYAQFENGISTMSDNLRFVWFYGLIGVFVLILACINFMNLSTARSEKRAKEVGVRKSIGSLKSQLMSQFLSESLLVAFLSFILSLILVSLTLPWFNQIADKALDIPWKEPLFIFISFGFTLLTGLLAGSYPAFYLSSFSAVKVLKGSIRTGSSAAIPRKLLVIFQFTISITLILGTIFVYQQIEHAKARPIGYERDRLVMIPKRTDELYGKTELIKNELIRTGLVESVGESNYPLTNTLGSNSGFVWPGKDPNAVIAFNTTFINPEFGPTINWEVVEGRNFSADLGSDRNGIILNETAKKVMGLVNPIGTSVEIQNENSRRNGAKFTVLGVVKDLIKGSPFEEAVPAIMFLSNDPMFWMFVSVKENVKMNEAVLEMGKVFKEIVPNAPIDMIYVEDVYASKFRAEERLGSLASFFSILAILISCIGLFGLSAYTAERRTKEIGIRKVLGASVMKLWQLLSKDFILLVLISILIASPVAYLIMDHWLENYPYRIHLSLEIFILVAIAAMGICMLTISVQILRVSLLNPAESLRDE